MILYHVALTDYNSKIKLYRNKKLFGGWKKCEDVFIVSDQHLTYCFVSCRKNKIAKTSIITMSWFLWFFRSSLMKLCLLFEHVGIQKWCSFLHSIVPRSGSTGRFRQENNGHRWNMEAVFRSEILRTFPDDFLPESTGIYRKISIVVF